MVWAGEQEISYQDQVVGCSQRYNPVLPNLAITGKFTGPRILISALYSWSTVDTPNLEAG